MRVAVFIISLFSLSDSCSPIAPNCRKLNIGHIPATSPYQAAAHYREGTGLFKKYGLDIAPILPPGGSLGFSARCWAAMYQWLF